MPAPVSVTREQYLESLGAMLAAARAFAAGYSLDQLTWQPSAGERWSILECLDHLAVSAGLQLDALERAAADARPGPGAGLFRSGGLFATWFLHQLEPPPSRRIPSPALFRPRPTLKPEGILPGFEQVMERLRALAASAPARDFNTVRFRNVLVPVVRFTLASGLLMVAAHTRRHLWQAEQVTKEPDFPGAGPKS